MTEIRETTHKFVQDMLDKCEKDGCCAPYAYVTGYLEGLVGELLGKLPTKVRNEYIENLKKGA